MFFTFFAHFNAILLGFLSQDSAEADIGWGEKLSGHLMASCVRNIHTKNYENLIILVQVRIKNVWDVFYAVYNDWKQKETVVTTNYFTYIYQATANILLA